MQGRPKGYLFLSSDSLNFTKISLTNLPKTTSHFTSR